ncbi:MAG: O-antigen ligase family protein [Cyanothece sp. SIO1E1]|nr:O-antigen ligase family protein [Cyanothece sp. SIO1E1]
MSQAWYFAALAGWMIAAADFGRRRSLVRIILVAITVAGSVWCAVGVITIVMDANGFWLWLYELPRNKLAGYPFATFNHHSVVAAQLNLIWPILFAFFLYFRDEDRRQASIASVWTIVTAVGLIMFFVALVVNVSKAGLLLGIPGLVGMYFVRRRYFNYEEKLIDEEETYPGWDPIRKPLGPRVIKFAIIGSIIGAICLVLILGNWEMLKTRWLAFLVEGGETFESNSRWAGWATAFSLLIESNFLGFGPGSWMYVFPTFAEDEYLKTFYLWLQYAHNDYLQFMVEWGVLGLIAWCVVLFGALVAGIGKLRDHMHRDFSLKTACVLGMTTALSLTLLHASFDFPFQFPAVQLSALLYASFLWSR